MHLCSALFSIWKSYSGAVKLQKEREKAKEERKKVKEEGKKDKRNTKEKRKDRKDKKGKKEKKERKEKEGKSTHNGEDKVKESKLNHVESYHLEKVRVEPGIGCLQKDDDNEQLERSAITEEHDQPFSLNEPSCLSDSTQSSNKRKRSTSPSSKDSGECKFVLNDDFSIYYYVYSQYLYLILDSV